MSQIGATIDIIFSDEVQVKWINPTVYKEEEARNDVLTQVFRAVDKCRFTLSGMVESSIYLGEQYTPFITYLFISWIWIQHGHDVTPKFRLLQSNYRKMTIKWSFSYNCFVKLSLYNTIRCPFL